MTVIRDDMAIVVVNYGSTDLVRISTAPLRAAGIRVVVVDNWHSDDERRAIRALCDELGLELVENRNDGFGAGMNLGVKRADDLGARVVVLLNPDAIIDAQSAESIARQADDGDRMLVAPTILDGTGRVSFAGGTLDRASGETRSLRTTERPPDWLSGACLAFRMDDWHTVGGFDDEYFMYWEDIDLSVRWIAAGGSLAVAPETIVHDAGGTQAGTGKSPLYVYYNCRNRLLFAARNIPRSDRAAWRRTAGRYAWRVVQRGGRRELLRHAPSLLGAAVRGSFGGRRLLIAAG